MVPTLIVSALINIWVFGLTENYFPKINIDELVNNSNGLPSEE